MSIVITAGRAFSWVILGVLGFLAASLLLGAIGGALWPYEEAGVARSAVGGAMGLFSVALVLGIFGVPILIGFAIVWTCLAQVVPILERDRRTTVTILSLLSVAIAFVIHLASPEEPPFSYLAPMLWVGIAAPRLVLGTRSLSATAPVDLTLDVTGIQLPPSWEWTLPLQPGGLSKELEREAPKGHVLYGRRTAAVARSTASDDVIFVTLDPPRRFYLVHLTWNRESRPEWPSTAEFASLEEAVRALERGEWG